MTTYLEVLKASEEWQRSFLSGIAAIFQQTGGGDVGFAAGQREAHIDAVQSLGPMGLLGKVACDDGNGLFELLNRCLAPLGDHQFGIPKALLLGMQDLVSAHLRVHQVVRAYEAMLRDTWDGSLKRFAVQVKSGRSGGDFKDFFDAYRATFAEGYAQLLRSPAFIKAQTELVETLSDFVGCVRKVIEGQMSMCPGLPLVTTSEMDALVRNVHSYKRRLDGLERKARERGAAEEERLRLLDQRISELEAQAASAGAVQGNGGTRTGVRPAVTRAQRRRSR